MSERRVNLNLHGVCGLGVFEETLAKRSFDTLHKSTGSFIVVKLQLWHYAYSVSAAVVNPTAFLPHHTSQCTSGDDAFATQSDPQHEPVVTFYRRRPLRRPALWQPAPGVPAWPGLCSRIFNTVRRWCFWRRNVFNLTSPTFHVREIPFLVSHATFLPFRYTYRLDSSRARPAQSENIAIANPID